MLATSLRLLISQMQVRTTDMLLDSQSYASWYYHIIYYAAVPSEIPECLNRRKGIFCNSVPAIDTRTFDGTCNNLNFSTWGASYTPFQRILPAHFEDGLQQPHGFRQSKQIGNKFRYGRRRVAGPFTPPYPSGRRRVAGPFTPPYPSARLVSSTVIRDRLDNDTQLTHLVMQWGQFLAHDLNSAVEVSPKEAQCDIVNCTCTDICFPVQVPRIMI